MNDIDKSGTIQYINAAIKAMEACKVELTSEASGTIHNISVAPSRFVTVKVAAVVTGLTEKAIRAKIHSGTWVEGREYRRCQGAVFVDLKGYESWVLQAA